jgi:hypothetical protein
MKLTDSGSRKNVTKFVLLVTDGQCLVPAGTHISLEKAMEWDKVTLTALETVSRSVATSIVGTTSFWKPLMKSELFSSIAFDTLSIASVSAPTA